MAVFFEGRQTQNSEDNIELGDGGGMTSAVWYFMGWLFFFEEPGEVFFGSEFILTVVDMHVDVDQHTYTHIDATTAASEFTHCQSMRFCNLWQPNKGGC